MKAFDTDSQSGSMFWIATFALAMANLDKPKAAVHSSAKFCCPNREERHDSEEGAQSKAESIDREDTSALVSAADDPP